MLNQRKNVLIVCVDCLRADVLNEVLLEHSIWKQISKYCTRYSNAYTASPWTYPATNSILSGKYPRNHQARQTSIFKNSVKQPWPTPINNVPTLFSILNKHDYFTFGISTIYWALNENCNYPGIDKIIRSEEQNVFYKNVKASWVVEKANELLLSRPLEQPFFGYIHLCDLHRPYDSDIGKKYGGISSSLLEGVEEWNIEPHLHNENSIIRFKRQKKNLYRGLVGYVLDQIQLILQFLDELQLLNNSYIILTADHGEEFWEHHDYEIEHYNCGYRTENTWLLGTGHGHTMFNEVIKIPLFLIDFSKASGVREQFDPVSQVDIAPTICAVLDIAPPCSFDGTSLLNTTPGRSVLVESTLYGYERKAIICKDEKYIYSPYEDGLVKYHLRSDPQEVHPIQSPIEDEKSRHLRRLYAEDEQSFSEVHQSKLQ